MKKIMKKITIILLVTFICGLFSQYSYAVTNPVISMSEIVLPGNVGKILEEYRGTQDGEVILIKDLHCDAATQKNIAKIITETQKNYKNKLKVIGLEGSYDGEINTKILENIKNKKAKQFLIDDLTEKGYLSGGELFKIENQNNIKLLGLEEKNTYLENFERLYTSLKLKADVSEKITYFENKIARLKKYVFSEELKAFEVEETKFSRAKIGIKDYLRYLKTTANRNEIGMNDFVNINTKLQINELEKKLNLTLTSYEAKLILKNLSKKLERKKLETLEIKDEKFYINLKKFINEQNIILDDYKNLEEYFRYLDLNETLDYVKMYEEMRQLTRLIKRKMLADQKDALLVMESEINMKLLEKYLSNSVSSYEAEEWRGNRKEIYQNLDELSNRVLYKNYFEEMREKLEQAEENMNKFYDGAEKRNEEMMKNLLKEKKSNVKIAIVGGYHAEGITKLMKSRGISYKLITPVSNGNYDKDLYLKRVEKQMNWLRKEGGKVEGEIETGRESLMLINAFTTGIVGEEVLANAEKLQFEMGRDEFIELMKNIKKLGEIGDEKLTIVKEADGNVKVIIYGRELTLTTAGKQNTVSQTLTGCGVLVKTSVAAANPTTALTALATGAVALFGKEPSEVTLLNIESIPKDQRNFLQKSFPTILKQVLKHRSETAFRAEQFTFVISDSQDPYVFTRPDTDKPGHYQIVISSSMLKLLYNLPSSDGLLNYFVSYVFFKTKLRSNILFSIFLHELHELELLNTGVDQDEAHRRTVEYMRTPGPQKHNTSSKELLSYFKSIKKEDIFPFLKILVNTGKNLSDLDFLENLQNTDETKITKNEIELAAKILIVIADTEGTARAAEILMKMTSSDAGQNLAAAILKKMASIEDEGGIVTAAAILTKMTDSVQTKVVKILALGFSLKQGSKILAEMGSEQAAIILAEMTLSKPAHAAAMIEKISLAKLDKAVAILAKMALTKPVQAAAILETIADSKQGLIQAAAILGTMADSKQGIAQAAAILGTMAGSKRGIVQAAAILGTMADSVQGLEKAVNILTKIAISDRGLIQTTAILASMASSDQWLVQAANILIKMTDSDPELTQTLQILTLMTDNIKYGRDRAAKLLAKMALSGQGLAQATIIVTKMAELDPSRAADLLVRISLSQDTQAIATTIFEKILKNQDKKIKEIGIAILQSLPKVEYSEKLVNSISKPKLLSILLSLITISLIAAVVIFFVGLFTPGLNLLFILTSVITMAIGIATIILIVRQDNFLLFRSLWKKSLEIKNITVLQYLSIEIKKTLGFIMSFINYVSSLLLALRNKIKKSRDTNESDEAVDTDQDSSTFADSDPAIAADILVEMATSKPADAAAILKGMSGQNVSRATAILVKMADSGASKSAADILVEISVLAPALAVAILKEMSDYQTRDHAADILVEMATSERGLAKATTILAKLADSDPARAVAILETIQFIIVDDNDIMDDSDRILVHASKFLVKMTYSESDGAAVILKEMAISKPDLVAKIVAKMAAASPEQTATIITKIALSNQDLVTVMLTDIDLATKILPIMSHSETTQPIISKIFEKNLKSTNKKIRKQWNKILENLPKNGYTKAFVSRISKPKLVPIMLLISAICFVGAVAILSLGLLAPGFNLFFILTLLTIIVSGILIIKLIKHPANLLFFKLFKKNWQLKNIEMPIATELIGPVDVQTPGIVEETSELRLGNIDSLSLAEKKFLKRSLPAVLKQVLKHQSEHKIGGTVFKAEQFSFAISDSTDHSIFTRLDPEKPGHYQIVMSPSMLKLLYNLPSALPTFFTYFLSNSFTYRWLPNSIYYYLSGLRSNFLFPILLYELHKFELINTGINQEQAHSLTIEYMRMNPATSPEILIQEISNYLVYIKKEDVSQFLQMLINIGLNLSALKFLENLQKKDKTKITENELELAAKILLVIDSSEGIQQSVETLRKMTDSETGLDLAAAILTKISGSQRGLLRATAIWTEMYVSKPTQAAAVLGKMADLKPDKAAAILTKITGSQPHIAIMILQDMIVSEQSLAQAAAILAKMAGSDPGLTVKILTTMSQSENTQAIAHTIFEKILKNNDPKIRKKGLAILQNLPNNEYTKALINSISKPKLVPIISLIIATCLVAAVVIFFVGLLTPGLNVFFILTSIPAIIIIILLIKLNLHQDVFLLLALWKKSWALRNITAVPEAGFKKMKLPTIEISFLTRVKQIFELIIKIFTHPATFLFLALGLVLLIFFAGLIIPMLSPGLSSLFIVTSLSMISFVVSTLKKFIYNAMEIIINFITAPVRFIMGGLFIPSLNLIFLLKTLTLIAGIVFIISKIKPKLIPDGIKQKLNLVISTLQFILSPASFLFKKATSWKNKEKAFSTGAQGAVDRVNKIYVDRMGKIAGKLDTTSLEQFWKQRKQTQIPETTIQTTSVRGIIEDAATNAGFSQVIFEGRKRVSVIRTEENTLIMTRGFVNNLEKIYEIWRHKYGERLAIEKITAIIKEMISHEVVEQNLINANLDPEEAHKRALEVSGDLQKLFFKENGVFDLLDELMSVKVTNRIELEKMMEKVKKLGQLLEIDEKQILEKFGLEEIAEEYSIIPTVKTYIIELDKFPGKNLKEIMQKVNAEFGIFGIFGKLKPNVAIILRGDLSYIGAEEVKYLNSLRLNGNLVDSSISWVGGKSTLAALETNEFLQRLAQLDLLKAGVVTPYGKLVIGNYSLEVLKTLSPDLKALIIGLNERLKNLEFAKIKEFLDEVTRLEKEGEKISEEDQAKLAKQLEIQEETTAVSAIYEAKDEELGMLVETTMNLKDDVFVESNVKFRDKVVLDIATKTDALSQAKRIILVTKVMTKHFGNRALKTVEAMLGRQKERERERMEMKGLAATAAAA